MAWQDMQKTMKLLAALSEMGKEGHQQKGDGKGGKKQDDTKKRWCHWQTCTAAQQGRPTLQGKVNCFSCGTHFSKTPPLEMMADWAFQDKLKQTQQKEDGKGNGPTSGKGKGKGKVRSPHLPLPRPAPTTLPSWPRCVRTGWPPSSKRPRVQNHLSLARLAPRRNRLLLLRRTSRTPGHKKKPRPWILEPWSLPR